MRRTILVASCTFLLTALSLSTGARAQSHFVRLGDASAGTAARITVADLSDDRVLAAVHDGSGNLKLIVWDVTSDGKFTRRGSIEAGKTSMLALATLGAGEAVTAVK